MENIVIGNRIPRNFFVTKGYGESGVTQHAGSYHFALHNAGIEMCNIMTYSSILPAVATRIYTRPDLVHGSVMECIMAVCHGTEDQYVSAGITYAWLYDNSNKKVGGIVCEYADNVSEETIKTKLHNALIELYVKNYKHFEIREVEVHTSSQLCANRFGTAIVALCFTDYIIPVIKEV